VHPVSPPSEAKPCRWTDGFAELELADRAETSPI